MSKYVYLINCRKVLSFCCIKENYNVPFLQAYVFRDYWEDIGTIKSFYEANLALTDEVPLIFFCLFCSFYACFFESEMSTILRAVP